MKDIVLIENDTKSFEEPMNAEMHKSLVHFEGELIKIRTNRAHPSLVEDIMVECYDGNPMPIKNVAAISASEARLIVIQPWDITTIPAIEKAVKNAELGVSPVVDGKLIRIRLPEMSTTRRDELAKILGRKLEDCKIGMRNVRKDFHNLIRDAKKDKKISENFFNRLSDSLQAVTDKWIAKAEQLSEKKEAEIKSV